MTNSSKHNTLLHKVFGIVEILIASYLSFENAYRFYDYKVHPHALRIINTPEWYLIYNIIIGIIGIYCGIQILKLRWTIIKGYLLFALLWLIGVALYILTYYI